MFHVEKFVTRLATSTTQLRTILQLPLPEYLTRRCSWKMALAVLWLIVIVVVLWLIVIVVLGPCHILEDRDLRSVRPAYASRDLPVATRQLPFFSTTFGFPYSHSMDRQVHLPQMHGQREKWTEKKVTQEESDCYRHRLENLPATGDPWISGKQIEIPGDKYRQYAKTMISINGQDYEATIDLSRPSMMNTSILKDMPITPVPFFPGKSQFRVSFVTSVFEPRKTDRPLEFRNITVESSFRPVDIPNSKIAVIFAHMVHGTQFQYFSADLRVGYSIPVRLGPSYEPTRKHLSKPFTKDKPKPNDMDKQEPAITDKPKPIPMDQTAGKIMRKVFGT
jgi:hypothetical protein